MCPEIDTRSHRNRPVYVALIILWTSTAVQLLLAAAMYGPDLSPGDRGIRFAALVVAVPVVFGLVATALLLRLRR